MHESLVTTVGLVTKIQSVETGKKSSIDRHDRTKEFGTVYQW